MCCFSVKTLILKWNSLLYINESFWMCLERNFYWTLLPSVANQRYYQSCNFLRPRQEKNSYQNLPHSYTRYLFWRKGILVMIIIVFSHSLFCIKKLISLWLGKLHRLRKKLTSSTVASPLLSQLRNWPDMASTEN